MAETNYENKLWRFIVVQTHLLRLLCMDLFGTNDLISNDFGNSILRKEREVDIVDNKHGDE